jgi:hypothetical protein
MLLFYVGTIPKGQVKVSPEMFLSVKWILNEVH